MPDFLRYGRRAMRSQAALGHRAGGPAAPGRKANDGMAAGWQSRGLGAARLRALKRLGHGLFGNLLQAMSLAASGLHGGPPPASDDRFWAVGAPRRYTALFLFRGMRG